MEIAMNDFWKGVITGVAGSVFVIGGFFILWFFQRRDKELMEYVERQYVERQHAVEILREDYISRDPYEFLDTIPGASRAVDDAYTEFERSRDEILQRFRDRLAD